MRRTSLCCESAWAVLWPPSRPRSTDCLRPGSLPCHPLQARGVLYCCWGPSEPGSKQSPCSSGPAVPLRGLSRVHKRSRGGLLREDRHPGGVLSGVYIQMSTPQKLSHSGFRAFSPLLPLNSSSLHLVLWDHPNIELRT